MNNGEFFSSAPEHWSLPLTPRPANRSMAIWQQQEYVLCLQCGFSFSGHSEGVTRMWHYKLPTPGGWVYLTVRNPGGNFQVTDENVHGNPFMPKTEKRA